MIQGLKRCARDYVDRHGRVYYQARNGPATIVKVFVLSGDTRYDGTGFSVCHEVDEFDEELALSMATGRAKSLVALKLAVAAVEGRDWLALGPML